ncbi:MAG: ABC transporter ATP-binding protein [Candidatus Stahlbacteria bacterium]|nr:ABC transporter ATP-binding protein [Candidatus Stahlbacteria bacterium]
MDIKIMDNIAIKVNGLTKIYTQSNKPPVVAVDKISFAIEKGKIVGLLGPNGAGKTTTIKCICGLVIPTEGHIFMEEIDINRNLRFGMSKISAVLEGNRNVYWRLTPCENLAFFAGLQGISYRSVKPYTNKLIELFKLQDKRNTQARYLSRGMQQKLAVACAFVKQTDILLLDEPTVGLDVESSYELRELIKNMAKESGKTVLISSHDMGVVESICDCVIIINKGKIVTDDSISNLFKLFSTSSYRFEVLDKLSTLQKEQIQSQFDLAKIVEKDSQTIIDTELKTHDELYNLIDILKSNGSKIESITRKEPDFEEIFLKIVKNEK